MRPHGRVVIADFAPHELECLRIEHVHRRLGFGAHEVIDWLDEAGFVPCPPRHLLAPRDGLVVSLWAGERRAA